jgi:hypothetical protein
MWYTTGIHTKGLFLLTLFKIIEERKTNDTAPHNNDIVSSSVLLSGEEIFVFSPLF